MICVNCKKEIPNNGVFCAFCGTPVAKQSAPAGGAACPVCKNADSVQKIKAILEAGTRRTTGGVTVGTQTDISGRARHYKGTVFPDYMGSSKVSGTAYSTHTSSIDVTEQTDLAARLTPPQSPVEPDKPKMFNPTLFLTLFFAILVPTLINVGMSQVLWPTVDLAVSWALQIGLTIVFLRFIYLPRKRAREKLIEQAYGEIMKRHQLEMEHWRKACLRWESAYFCHRDYVVFVPNEAKYTTPEQLIGLCYEQT